MMKPFYLPSMPFVSQFDGAPLAKLAGLALFGIVAFQTLAIDLTIGATPDEWGTVTPAEGLYTVEFGAVVDLKAEASPGYVFNQWMVSPPCGCNGQVADKKSAETTVKVTGNMSVTATFAEEVTEVSLTMVVSPDAAGATDPVVGTSTVELGREFSIQAIAASSYKLSRWTASPAENVEFEDATQAETTVTLVGDATVTAEFALVGATIDLTMGVSPDEGGTSTPSGTTAVSLGVGATIAATPAFGYSFDSWSASPEGDASIADADAAETTIVPYGPVTVTAYFVANENRLFATVTQGSVLAVSAEDVGLTSFDARPSVYVTGGELEAKRKKLKLLNSNSDFKRSGVETILCEFKPSLSVGSYVMRLEDRNSAWMDMPVGLVNVNGPVIHRVEPNTGTTGDAITLTGQYFGSKGLKIWLVGEDEDSGRTRRKKCRLDKPFMYADAKGRPKKSCMDLETGLSEVSFSVPRGVNLDANGRLLVVNRLGSVTVPFNAPNGGTDVTASEAVDLIDAHDGDDEFVILDVRTEDEYNSGHVKNAVNLDYYSPLFENDLDDLDKSAVYLVYCGSGGRSANAVSLMLELGFEEIYNMLRGFTAFKEVAPELIDYP